MSGRPSTLQLRSGPSGARHYLEERLVPGGSTVQLCFSGGWVTGRFEWSGDPTEAPRFFCSIELAPSGVAEHSLTIPERAVMRWPEP